MIADIAPRAFKDHAGENVFVLERIIKLNKKFPRATFDRIFEGRGGWTEARQRRILRRLRDQGCVTRKGKSKYKITLDGMIFLKEQLVIANDGKRVFEVDEQNKS
jgi:hypothetical protein